MHRFNVQLGQVEFGHSRARWRFPSKVKEHQNITCYMCPAVWLCKHVLRCVSRLCSSNVCYTEVRNTLQTLTKKIQHRKDRTDQSFGEIIFVRKAAIKRHAQQTSNMWNIEENVPYYRCDSGSHSCNKKKGYSLGERFISCVNSEFHCQNLQIISYSFKLVRWM